MDYNKVLIFDISSEYAHFRKINTTVSPLTYSTPTRPAIAGLLGAILGIKRELGPNNFPLGITPIAEIFGKKNAAIAIQIVNPISKTNMGFNLIDTGTSAASFHLIENRTQIGVELLKNACYRIYLSMYDENILEELKSRIENKRYVYTPYLGLSQFAATINYLGMEQLQQTQFNNEKCEVCTILNTNNVPAKQIEFNYDHELKVVCETMPIELTSNRITVEYAEVIMENNGKPIKILSDQIYCTESSKNIVFL